MQNDVIKYSWCFFSGRAVDISNGRQCGGKITVWANVEVSSDTINMALQNDVITTEVPWMHFFSTDLGWVMRHYVFHCTLIWCIYRDEREAAGVGERPTTLIADDAAILLLLRVSSRRRGGLKNHPIILKKVTFQYCGCTLTYCFVDF